MVANHQSMLDILLLSHLPREMKWVAKESLFRTPWVGWMLRMSGDIPVRRGDAESGGEALARARRRYLARGMSIMIFPEGTRSATGTLLPFKNGAFRLAIEAGVPVLPVAVNGTGAGMPKGGPVGEPLPRGREDARARSRSPASGPRRPGGSGTRSARGSRRPCRPVPPRRGLVRRLPLRTRIVGRPRERTTPGRARCRTDARLGSAEPRQTLDGCSPGH